MKDESCMILLKQINDGLEKFSNNIVKEEGLTFTQINVMNLLAKSKRGEMTMKEIEKKLHVAQPTVVGIVKRLSQKSCFKRSMAITLLWIMERNKPL